MEPIVIEPGKAIPPLPTMRDIVAKMIASGADADKIQAFYTYTAQLRDEVFFAAGTAAEIQGALDTLSVTGEIRATWNQVLSTINK